MRYRPEIDGLRAVSVIPVLLFHAEIALFSGGFVGVDVFFVISGYLITGILCEDLANRRFSLLHFYERRIRRILPALLFVVVCCIPAAWILMTPAHFRDFAQSVAATSLFASNFLFWLESGYFDAAAATKPLLHTWSLAVEEQFYLVFPLLLALFWRSGRGGAVIALAVIAVGSLALAEWASRTHPSANFYLFPTRAWELLAGSICALIHFGRQPPKNELLAAAGLAMIIAAILLFHPQLRAPGLVSLLPVGGCVLILLFGGTDTWTGRLLSIRPLVGIGLISYSAYLWHHPIYVFARMALGGSPPETVMLALAVFSLGLAWITWHFIEQPFRKRARPILPKRAGLFAATGMGISVLTAVGVAGHVKAGFPERFERSPLIASGEWTIAKVDNGWCFYSVSDMRQLEIGKPGLDCFVGAKEGEKRALLFGDSFAGQYEPFWDRVGREADLRIKSITTNWCFPALTDAFEGPKSDRSYRQCTFNRDYLRKNIDGFDIIILAGTWHRLKESGRLADTIALIEKLLRESEAEIVLMPVPHLLQPLSVEQRVYFGDVPLRQDMELEAKAEAAHAALRKLAAENRRIHFIERGAIFGSGDDEDDAWLTSDGLPFSLDGSHISIYGAKAAADFFLGASARHGALDFLRK